MKMTRNCILSSNLSTLLPRLLLSQLWRHVCGTFDNGWLKTNLWWLELGHSGHESVIIPNDEAIRNLAVWLQSTFSMCSHVPRTCKSAFLLPSQYKAQYKYLNQESAGRFIHAFVISRLDYCDSLLYTITSKSIEKLQRVQNAASRVVYRAPTICHITPMLFGLHWLPVRSRIIFHTLTIIFKAIHYMVPKYLSNLITFKTSSMCHLRSNNKFLLSPPSSKQQLAT